jgi:hypothetical protein
MVYGAITAGDRRMSLASEMRKLIRREADQFGAGVRFGVTGGNHQVATFSRAGRTRKLFFSMTPSDFRAPRRIRADAVRTLRSMESPD